MLNKKEREQVVTFVTATTECARELLDNVAEFEAILRENTDERKRQTEQRYQRKKRQKNRKKHGTV